LLSLISFADIFTDNIAAAIFGDDFQPFSPLSTLMFHVFEQRGDSLAMPPRDAAMLAADGVDYFADADATRLASLTIFSPRYAPRE
jgi:hypothetical protein